MKLDTLRHRPPKVERARVQGDIETLRDFQRRSMESPKRQETMQRKKGERAKSTDENEAIGDYFVERAEERAERQPDPTNERIVPFDSDTTLEA